MIDRTTPGYVAFYFFLLYSAELYSAVDCPETVVTVIHRGKRQ